MNESHTQKVHAQAIFWQQRHVIWFRLMLAALSLQLVASTPLDVLAAPSTGVAPVTVPSGGFAIEGNLLANTPTNGVGDWVINAGGGGVMGTNGVPLNPLTTFHITDPFTSTNDSIITGGNADADPNNWTWGLGSVQNKEDMNNGLLHIGYDSSNRVWLILSADHTGTGDADMYFYLLQNSIKRLTNGHFSSTGPNTGFTLNDLRLKLNFSGDTFAVDQWQTNSTGGGFHWVSVSSLLPANRVLMAVNAGNTYVPYGTFGSTNCPTGNFVEAAVELTTLFGNIDPCISAGFQSVFIATLHPSGTMSDFIDPFQAIVNVGFTVNAGADQTNCNQGASTAFLLNGVVTAGTFPTSQTNWSVVSGSVTIDSSNSVNTVAHVFSTTATLRLTANQSSACTEANTKFDDIVLTVLPTPTCSITGPTTVCPNSSNQFSASGMTTYSWSVSGNGSIVDPTNQATVSVIAGSGCGTNFTLSLDSITNLCTATCGVTVTVNDTTPPTITCPASLVLNCPASTTTNSTGVATAQDDCGQATVSYSDTVSNLCGNTQIILRRWTATDDCGNSTNCVQTITLQDTNAPSLTIPNDLVLDCPSDTTTNATGVATGSDSCSAIAIGYSDTVSNLCGNTKIISRLWTATDDCGNATSATQTITIQDTNAPSLTLPANITLDCPADTDTNSTGVATASDTCGAVVIGFSDSLSNLCGNTKIISRRWTATDDCGNISSATQFITVQDTNAPSLTLPADLTLSCPANSDTNETGVAKASDTCGSVVVGYSDSVSNNCGGTKVISRLWTATDECGNATSGTQTITVQDTNAPSLTIPANIALNCPSSATTNVTGAATASDFCGATTVSFTDTVSNLCGGTKIVFRLWTATDDCGNSVSDTQTITVQDTNAPSLTIPTSITLDCPNTATTNSTGVATASDSCGSATVSYSDTVSNLCGNTKIISRLWTATDDCGNATSATQTITIQDTNAPSLTLPANITLDCPAVTTTNVTGTATAVDACGSAVVTFVDTVSNLCGNTKIISRRWTATDDCGNISSATQFITVQDTNAPSLTIPATITLDCPAATTTNITGVATAVDTCSSAVITFSDTVSNLCGNTQIILRRWTATDDCGNFTNLVQTITVRDTNAPGLRIPADISISCPATAMTNLTGSATAVDTCSSASVSFTDTVSNLCGNTKIISRRWTATDSCGNSTNRTQTITVLDTNAPSLNIPTNITLTCPATTTTNVTGSATAVDTCGSATVSYSDIVSNGCGGSRVIQRLWTATDQCGNSTNRMQTITVQDLAPTLSCPGVNVQCAGDVPPAYTNLTQFRAAGGVATDSCDANLGFLLVSNSTLVGSCPGRVYRVYRVTDSCNNSTDCTQIITVDDTIPPVLTCASNRTVECGVSLLPANTGPATATDNCDTNVTISYTDAPASSSYSVDFYASDPDLNSGPYGPTHLRLAPGTLACPTGGRAQDPLRNAVCYAEGGALDGLTSLGGVPLALGQIVPYQVVISMSGAPGPEHGRVEVTCDWATHTTSNDRFGFDTNYMVYCAFVDPGDWGTIDPNTNAFVESVTSTLFNAGRVDEQIRGTFRVAGLDPGDRVVMEVWVVMDSTMSGNPGGNISSQFVEGHKLTTPPEAIGNGAKTISIGNLNKFIPLPAPQTQPPLPALPPQPAAGPRNITSVIDRTWTGVDDCGNSSSCVQRLAVVDTAPPALVIPANATLDCPNSNTATNFTGVATAVDACGVVVRISYADSVAPGCSGTGTISRMWTAVDNYGNATNRVQTITVRDITKPALTIPADVTLDCPVVTTTNATGAATATDGCSAVTISYSDSVSDLCGNTRIISRTWTAADQCGNTTNRVQMITVRDLVAPSLGIPADVSLECPAITTTNATGSATAVDVCSAATLTFSDTYSNGLGNTQTIFRRWTATDACGNSTNRVQTITVRDTVAPILNIPADVALACPAVATTNITGSASASDTCSSVAVSYSDSVSNSCSGSQTIFRRWTATDGIGNSTVRTQKIVIRDVTAPALMIPANVTLDCPATDTSTNATGIAVASDECSSVTLSYSDTETNACAGSKAISRLWTATDACGNSTSAVQMIVVQDANPPSLTVPQDLTLECPADTSTNTTGTATAVDTCGSVTLAYNDSLTNQVGATSVILRQWTATDACGNSASAVQTITVRDLAAPSLTVPGDLALDYPANTETNATGAAAAADTCGSATMSFSDTVSNSCGGTKIISRLWTATDESGNTTSAVQTITVQDTNAPTLTIPADVTLNCPASDTSTNITGNAIAIDAGSVATMGFSDMVSNLCGNTRQIFRTWVATDECGNTTSAVQAITVRDISAPSLNLPENLTLNCPADTGTNATGIATASDECGSATMSCSDTVSNSCGGTKIISRLWTATDDCGNSTNAIQTIIVQDTNAPSLTVPADVTLDCPATDTSTNATGNATASDSCSTVSVSYSDAVSNLCGNTRLIFRTWSAADECGNTTSAVQTITVQDTNAPTISALANFTATNGLAWSFSSPTATDGCGAATMEVIGDVTNGIDAVTFTVTRSWLATDACGNVAGCQQMITVVTPPVILEPFRLSMNTVSLRWPGYAAGFILETNADISTPNWGEVPIPPSLIDGEFSLQITSSIPRLYFRLRKP